MPLRLLLLALALVTAAYALAAATGAVRWARVTARLRTRLHAEGTDALAPRVDFDALDDLPPPVARYLRLVLKDRQPRIRGVRLRHRGDFNMDARGERWRPFRSDQVVVAHRPGFDWDAVVRMAPGVPVRVHDAYVAGEGLLQASLLGLVDVAHLAGGGAIAEGELMRWLAESPWYPTVLLPGGDVQWCALDSDSAEATVVDGAVRVSLVFRFGADGLVSGVEAAARGRTVDGRVVPTPWEGRFGAYASFDGMAIPTEGEVAWRLPDRRLPYWRGRIDDASYAFAR
ncbi:DUF6920 family protein [Lysobacter xanthus]